jgi:hypothetical protein
MDETTDNVKTIVPKDLSGYVKKSRLESFLEELLGKKIKVSVSLSPGAQGDAIV